MDAVAPPSFDVSLLHLQHAWQEFANSSSYVQAMLVVAEDAAAAAREALQD
jgi:hypothetical protein